MWLVKKYFFTNQLKNNLTKSSPISNDLVTTSIPNNNTRNYVLSLNLYNQNPQNQLNYLSLTVKPSSPAKDEFSASSMCNFHVNTGDLDILKANNLCFINKLTNSTSERDLKYYTLLAPLSLPTDSVRSLNFTK